MKNHGLTSKLFDYSNYIVLTLFTLSIVLPFYYMFTLSISGPREVGLQDVFLIPKSINFESYATVLQDNQIVTAYWNSIRYTVTGTFFVLFFGALLAHPLSLTRFRIRTPIAIMLTITMFFNGGIIPMFFLIKSLGMLDTIWAVTLPGAFSFWYVILLRTNFQSLPQALYESAYIDGANDWQIFFKVVLPLSKAIIATVGLFASVGFWNAFFGPLLYLTSSDMQPLTIILRRILIMNEVFSEDAMSAGMEVDADPITTFGRMVSLRMATIFITIGPIVLVYPFVQKYFVKGVLVGSVKG